MKPESSNYNAFLDGYNLKYNEYANRQATNFFDRVEVDKNLVIQNSDGILKKKFEHINAIMKDDTKESFDKVKLTGFILSDVVSELMTSKNDIIKQSGINIINSFFEVARKTEDNDLIETAKSITSKAS